MATAQLLINGIEYDLAGDYEREDTTAITDLQDKVADLVGGGGPGVYHFDIKRGNATATLHVLADTVSAAAVWLKPPSRAYFG